MCRFGLAAEVGRGYSKPANVSRARPPALSLRLATLVGYARLRSPQLDVTELDIERGFCKAGLNAPPSQKSRVGARESTANWAGSRVASSAPPRSAADETEFRETLGQTGGLPARTYPTSRDLTCAESGKRAEQNAPKEQKWGRWAGEKATKRAAVEASADICVASALRRRSGEVTVSLQTCRVPDHPR